MLEPCAENVAPGLTQLVTMDGSPSSVVANQQYVYFALGDEVYRSPTDGGCAELVHRAPNPVWAMALGGERVFVASEGRGRALVQSFDQIALDDIERHWSLEASSVVGVTELVVAGGQLYLQQGVGVLRVDIDSGATASIESSLAGTPRSLAAVGDRVYWTSGARAPMRDVDPWLGLGIESVGGNDEVELVSEAPCYELAASSAGVFCSSAPTLSDEGECVGGYGTLLQIAADGSVSEPPLEPVGHLAAGSDTLFVSEYRNQVAALEIASLGQAEPLAEADAYAYALTTNGNSAYYVTEQDGTWSIWALAPVVP